MSMTAFLHRASWPARIFCWSAGSLVVILAVTAAAAPSSATKSATRYSGALRGVSARSASDAWAVGEFTTSTEQQTLVLHWNGRSWTRVPSPNPGGVNGSGLAAVSARSASDAWAVGDFTTRAGVEQTLIVHWNGRSWTRVPSPDPGGVNGSGLAAVSARSRSAAWAAGSYAGRDGSEKTLVARWNGTTWRHVASPNPRGASSFLSGLSARSVSDIWAVGNYFPAGGGVKTLVLHWNGATWRRVTSPTPATALGVDLSGVSARSAADAWAVGNYTTTGVEQTLVLHWNGTRWKRAASPKPGGGSFSALSGVSALSATRAWAVGEFTTSTFAGKTLVLRWNGRLWSQS